MHQEVLPQERDLAVAVPQDPQLREQGHLAEEVPPKEARRQGEDREGDRLLREAAGDVPRRPPLNRGAQKGQGGLQRGLPAGGRRGLHHAPVVPCTPPAAPPAEKDDGPAGPDATPRGDEGGGLEFGEFGGFGESGDATKFWEFPHFKK